MRYDVNLSLVFGDVPLGRRAEAARAAGFGAVESWWPFETAAPDDKSVEEFVRSLDDAGVRLVAFNFFAGDMAAGDRGLASWIGREREWRDSVDTALGIAERLGCRVFNALYGNRIEGQKPEAQDELALSNLDWAADAAARIGASLVIEPLSGVPDYPLRTAADVLSVLDNLGRDDVKLLFDLYHLATNGDDLDAVLDAHFDHVGHVQFADAPGRHQPGTGNLDFDWYLAKLEAAGYDGHIGLEYLPLGPVERCFDWLKGHR